MSSERESAILMAAGLGTRMRPLTEKTPKPLLPVNGRPMIETVIDGLSARGVSEFYVVTGYLQEQFSYLPAKYPGLSLLPNHEYLEKNNISSLHAALKELQKTEKGCFICEADLFLADPSILSGDLTVSCYFGRMVPGHTDDWCFEQDSAGRITRVKKGGDDLYNMVGISYFRKPEALTLAKAIEDAYTRPDHAGLFWDEVVDRNLDRLPLYIHAIRSGQLMEIDTPQELEAVSAMTRSTPAQS
ncbi:MAG: NTP transferase domain-containing protein [Lachnospiraceae bacterium]|nr:NTP transferase domain-containing protein [Lachnospiraceae bacterium]